MKKVEPGVESSVYIMYSFFYQMTDEFRSDTVSVKELRRILMNTGEKLTAKEGVFSLFLPFVKQNHVISRASLVSYSRMCILLTI